MGIRGLPLSVCRKKPIYCLEVRHGGHRLAHHTILSSARIASLFFSLSSVVYSSIVYSIFRRQTVSSRRYASPHTTSNTVLLEQTIVNCVAQWQRVPPLGPQAQAKGKAMCWGVVGSLEGVGYLSFDLLWFGLSRLRFVYVRFPDVPSRVFSG